MKENKYDPVFIGAFIAFALMMSVGFLMGRNENLLNPKADHGWWSIAFAEPAQRDELSFLIHNEMAPASFRYRLYSDTELAGEGTVEIPTGESRLVSPPPSVGETQRVRIVVERTPDDRKEIYRDHR